MKAAGKYIKQNNHEITDVWEKEFVFSRIKGVTKVRCSQH